MKCDRCGQECWSSSVSYFNTETICFGCCQDERQAPNYAKARDAEHLAVLAGDSNFPGIGLAPEDVEFLAKRRKERGL